MRSSGLPKASRFLHTQKHAPLWEAAELSVIRTLPLSLQGSNNTALTGSRQRRVMLKKRIDNVNTLI